MTNSIDIVEHGTMLTDYFHGTSGIWLNVYIDKNTTIQGVMEMLENEIDMLWDHIEFIAEQKEFKGNLDQAINEKLDEMKSYIKGKEEKVYNSGLDFTFEDLEEYEEPSAAIFTIEFLND